VRDCPCVTNQELTKTKLGKMQTLLRSMTMTKRTEFKKYVLSNEDKLRTKTAPIPLSRETSPHANRTLTGVPPSRETGPHISQMLRQFAKIPERCKGCDGTHPTCICMKRFLKPQKPGSTPHLIYDDDSTGSDTLCDSKELEDSEIRPTTDLSTRLAKTVTFDLPSDKSMRSSTPYHADESESDDGSDNDSINTQQPTSQNDKVDARLVHAAWLRKASDNIYMSNQKAMNLRTYIHAAH